MGPCPEALEAGQPGSATAARSSKSAEEPLLGTPWTAARTPAAGARSISASMAGRETDAGPERPRNEGAVQSERLRVCPHGRVVKCCHHGVVTGEDVRIRRRKRRSVSRPAPMPEDQPAYSPVSLRSISIFPDRHCVISWSSRPRGNVDPLAFVNG